MKLKSIFAILLGASLALAASAEEPVLSGGISQIVKLSKSGVAPAVVEQYINSSQFPFKVTVDDMLHMHKEGVPVEIITTLMRRGEEIRRANAAIQAGEARMRARTPPGDPASVQEFVVLAPPAPPPFHPSLQPLAPVSPTYPTYPTYPAYPGYPYYPYRGYYDRGYGPSIGLGFGFSFRGGFGHGGGHRGYR
jgi:hypothetical protein